MRHSYTLAGNAGEVVAIVGGFEEWVQVYGFANCKIHKSLPNGGLSD